MPDLEKAITDAADGLVGADEMPDIFSSYADVAYTIEKKSGLADLSRYFTEEELSEYVDSYIQEGYFEGDKALYLFPVAKSTEIMMINKTDWEPFASATGVTLDQLSTLEGVREVAEKYYDWTDAMTPDVADDGKAFYGKLFYHWDEAAGKKSVPGEGRQGYCGYRQGEHPPAVG